LVSKQQKQEREVATHIYGIFFWGMIFGVLISYMSIFPLGLGFALGYVVCKKRWIVVDVLMEQWKPWIERITLVGQLYWRRWIGENMERKF
jgi:hypothetical protein